MNLKILKMEGKNEIAEERQNKIKRRRESKLLKRVWEEGE